MNIYIDQRIREWTIFNDFLSMANEYIHIYVDIDTSIFQKSKRSRFVVKVD